MLLPSEIESKWMIPAVRSIIAQQLVKRYEFSQTDVAQVLGVTQAAIYHYMNGSRGNNSVVRKLKRNRQIMLMIDDITKNLNDNQHFTPYCMSKYIELFNYARRSLFICKIHKSFQKDIDNQLCKTCESFILQVVQF